MFERKKQAILVGRKHRYFGEYKGYYWTHISSASDLTSAFWVAADRPHRIGVGELVLIEPFKWGSSDECWKLVENE